MPPEITVIPSRSLDGKELLGAILDLLKEFRCKATVLGKPTQKQVTLACGQADLVIIDATVESDTSWTPYAAMTAQPMVMDHVLVVSRTYLPLNFHGKREGGAPVYPKSFSDEDILHWLRVQLDELVPRLPRPWWAKNLIGSTIAYTLNVGTLKSRDPQPRQIFLSFRNRHFGAALELKTRIERGELHANPPEVLCFEPGILSFEDEILTGFQRWHVMSLVEERLRACHEFWVLQSDDYYDSWWTRGELVLNGCSWVKGGPGRPAKKVIPIVGDQPLNVQPLTDLPVVTPEQKRILDRMLTHSGRTMGAETAQRTRELAELPFLKDLDFYTNPIFSLKYLTEPLIELPRPNPSDGQLKTSVHPQSFLDMSDPPLQPVPREILDTALRQGSAQFESFEIRPQAHPRFLWYATRMGRVTGPEFSEERTMARQQVFRARRMS